MEPAIHRPHRKMGFRGGVQFCWSFLAELFSNLPACFALRRSYAATRRAPGSESADPVLAWVGDNLDEVNGIALSSRIMLRELRAQGKHVFLWGVAFHTKPPRAEGPDHAVILSPGRFSLDQAGYAESEIAIPRVAAFLDFLRERRVDVVEFETPGTVAALCLIACRIIGIRTLSHYRTDIPTYARLLVSNALGAWYVITWTKVFTRLAGPVVVPSNAYRDKVREIGVPAARIHRLQRGVDLRSFHPDKAALGAWARLGLPSGGVRLLYVGRVSREKNLELLVDAFERLSAARPELSLTVVGDGPLKPWMEGRLGSHPRVRFTGVVQGEDLYSIFASADLFLFPSLTDTFGNSVIEALASGLPCITSDQGGPREIIEDGSCGLAFDSGRPGDLEAKIVALASDPERLKAMRAKARERALRFSYDEAAKGFWNFYSAFHRGEIR